MIDQTPLTKRHGLALSTFALWQVNISHTGNVTQVFTLIFIELLLIYLEEHNGQHPYAKLHMHAKFQLPAFYNFQAIMWRKLVLSVSQSVTHTCNQLKMRRQPQPMLKISDLTLQYC